MFQPSLINEVQPSLLIQVNESSFIKKSLFNWGLSRKTWFLKQGRLQGKVREAGQAAGQGE